MLNRKVLSDPSLGAGGEQAGLAYRSTARRNAYICKVLPTELDCASWWGECSRCSCGSTGHLYVAPREDKWPRELRPCGTTAVSHRKPCLHVACDRRQLRVGERRKKESDETPPSLR